MDALFSALERQLVRFFLLYFISMNYDKYIFMCVLRRRDAWFLPTLRPSDTLSRGKGHAALVLPTPDAVRYDHMMTITSIKDK